MRGLLRPAPLAAALLALVVAATNRDLLTGGAVPFYRDIGSTHRPARAAYAALGPARTLPAASFGQPYIGNPNFVLAYPFPRAPRFLGLHLLLHLGIGLAGAFAFLSRLVRAPEAALLGAIAFALSGYTLSSTAFLNATTTLAWVPWVLWATLALRGASGWKLAARVAVLAGAIALSILGGEPALAALGLTAAFTLAAFADPPGERRSWRARAAHAGLVAGAALLAALALSPWLLEVWRSSEPSTRRARGFSWTEFAAVGFHPLRLLETPFPGIFGDPSRLVSGAFWGFAATQGNPPYLASLSFGVLPLALALVFAAGARRGEARVFLGLGVFALALALFPWWPGGRALYEALPPLHALRYPVKAMLLVTLSVAALAAFGMDRLLVEESLPRYRRRASVALMAAAGLLAAIAVAGRTNPSRVEALLARGWDAAWQARPHDVLEPIVRHLPGQAALGAAALLLLAVLLRRGAPDPRGRLILLAAAGTELLVASRAAIPRLPRELTDAPSPLVARAVSLGGRTFERTGKDLDPVRRGLFGHYPSDDLAWLGAAQLRQGWALTGAAFGLRYAYDPDPDGSYTLATRIATDVVLSRDWARRVKWLRSAGVTSVIAHDVPPGTPGLTPLLQEGGIGIPTTLYAVDDPLPGVRRLSRVHPSRIVNDAVALFERYDFDPQTDGVVAGGVPPGLSDAALDPDADARVLSESADALAIETSGSAPALLHVDRTFTRRVTAAVNGARARPVAVGIHLIGVPVPAGRARVEILLAP